MVDNLESVSVQIENGKFKPFIVTSIYRLPEKPVSYYLTRALRAVSSKAIQAPKVRAMSVAGWLVMVSTSTWTMAFRDCRLPDH